MVQKILKYVLPEILQIQNANIIVECELCLGEEREEDVWTSSMINLN
jgi:hypothetical protein